MSVLNNFKKYMEAWNKHENVSKAVAYATENGFEYTCIGKCEGKDKYNTVYEIEHEFVKAVAPLDSHNIVVFTSDSEDMETPKVFDGAPFEWASTATRAKIAVWLLENVNPDMHLTEFHACRAFIEALRSIFTYMTYEECAYYWAHMEDSAAIKKLLEYNNNLERFEGSAEIDCMLRILCDDNPAYLEFKDEESELKLWKALELATLMGMNIVYVINYGAFHRNYYLISKPEN